jgi:hypothetical protein
VAEAKLANAYLIFDGPPAFGKLNVKACLTPEPELGDTVLGGRPLVKLNMAAVAAPAVVANTVEDPIRPFAVNSVAVATPMESVRTVTEEEFPEKLLVGSGGTRFEKGAVKLTCTPPSGLPRTSVTRACNSVGNAVSTGVVCPEPCLG